MPNNNKFVIAERREQISKMYLEGWPQFRIAEKVKVTQQQVSKDLSVLRRVWQLNATQNTDKYISKELAKIDKLEYEYWTAWRKSIENYEKSKKKFVDKKQKELTKEEVIVFGDPRFLHGIERCIERRCKLLGLDLPEKFDHTSKGEKLNTIPIITIARKNDNTEQSAS